jgi:hypothetical protein
MGLIPLGILSSAATIFPSFIPDLVARYDASDLSSIALSGSDVTQWNDVSGNARHATQGTSTNRPKSGTRTINGINAIDFDGTNDFLINNGISASYTGTNKPFTIFQVSQLDTTTGSQTSWGIASSTTSPPRIFPSNATLFIRNNANTQIGAEITGAYNTNAQFLTYRSSGTNITGFLNKTLTVTQSYSLGAISLNNSHIGAFRSSGFPDGVQFWNGLIGEMIYYNRELTALEVSQVHDYLSAKWLI